MPAAHHRDHPAPGPNAPMRVIAHLDMDAFYAAIEQRDHAELRGKPVIVGGSPKSRGVVSTASYEARVFGVRSAMPTREAYRLCPQGNFVPVRMRYYAEVSNRVMEILSHFSPVIEQVSIDEAFIDLTGTEHLLGRPAQVAREMKRRIRDELSLTASIGVAPNKFLAKVASDLKKPDALVIVDPDYVESFLAPLAVSKLWGVGGKLEARLRRIGVSTIGQLQQYDAETLTKKFGTVGKHLWALAHGNDDRPVVTEGEAKSISNETTFEEDIAEAYPLESVLLELSEQLGYRLRRHELMARTVNLKLRFASFQTITRARTLGEPTDLDSMVYETVVSLFRRVRLTQPVRLLGVGASQLVASDAVRQLSLFDNSEKRRRLDRAADRLRKKFGESAVTKARLVQP